MPVLYPATLERYVTVKGKTCRKWIYKTLLFYVIVSCFNQAVTAQEQKKADLLNQENEFQNQQQKELEEKIKARPGMRDLLILQQNQYKEENAQENLKSVIRAAELAEQNRIAAKKLEESREGNPIPLLTYKIYKDPGNQTAFQVTRGNDVIYRKQVTASANGYNSEVQAEREAIFAYRTLRRNFQYPPDAISSEIAALSANQYHATNLRNARNQTTLADITFNGAGGGIPGSGTSGPASPYPSTINVSGVPVGSNVKSVTLTGVNHTWPDDIDVVLQSPSGINVILMSDVGGGTDLVNVNLTFDDGAGQPLSDEGPLTSGTYLPTNVGSGDNWTAPGPGSAPSAITLATFGTGDHNGTWSLFIVDDTGLDSGDWGSWSITFSEPPAMCSPFTITSDPADTDVCQDPSPSSVATFSVSADQPGVTFNWQEDQGSGFAYLANGGVYSGVDTETLTITGATAAMDGYRYRCVVICPTGGLPEISNAATLTVLPPPPTAPVISPLSAAICPGGSVDLAIISSQSAPSVTENSGPGLGLVINNTLPPATSSLNISGFPVAIASISVNFNITHTWDSDLKINLVAPNGNILNLVNARGSSGDNFTNTTISSTSGNSLSTSSAPFTGTFAADAVNGVGVAPYLSNTTQWSDLFSPPNGTWTLVVSDHFGGDNGTLDSWSITLNGVAVPDPAVWSPATGLFNDAALTSPYIDGTFQTKVYAAPSVTTTYSAQITDGTCLSPATNVTVAANIPPAITSHPGNGNACVGDVKSFNVTATGSGLTYQWQVDQGSGYVDLPSGSPYGGVTSNTLTITSVPNAFDGYKYRCIVSGDCPPVLTSDEVTLSVNQAPVITVTPSYMCSPVLLTASGADSYTWSPADGLSATTGASVSSTISSPVVYTVTGTNTTTGCTGMGDVMVIGTPGTPSIDPASATICEGSYQELSSSSISSFSNGGTIPIPGTGTSGPASPYPSEINVSGLAATGVIVKSVTIKNLSHTWMSDIDILLQSPSGVNVVLMSDVSGNFGVSNATYTFDDAAASTMTGAPPASGTWKPTNVGSSDTWTAPGPGSISQASPALSMFGSGNHNGVWKLFIVDDVGGDSGELTGGWSITFASGSTVEFTPLIGLFTDAGLSNPYTGGQVSQVFASPAATTTYTAVATNTGPAGKSTFAYTGSALTAGTSSGPFSIYPATVSVTSLPTTGVSVKSVKLNGISHTFPSDIDILLQSPTGEYVVLMSDIGGGTDIYDVDYLIMDGAAPFSSSFNPPGVYSPTNSGSTDTWDTPLPPSFTQASPSLSMFTGDPNGTWNLFARDDAGGDGGSIQSFEITFEYGTNSCSSPARSVTVTVHIPVVFTTQPQSKTVCEGTDVTFSVDATGTVQSTQWQVSTNGGANWNNISGANSNTLTLTGVTPSMNGYLYRCQKTSQGCGNEYSELAVLNVNANPTVSLSILPIGQTTLEPGMFTTINVSSTPAGVNYAWFVNGDPVAGASGSSFTASAFDLGTYTVQVTDMNGCSGTSASLKLEGKPSDNLFIFPNPASGAYTVTYYIPSAKTPISINILDMTGRRVEERQEETTGPYTRFEFDASKLAAGVYVIEILDPQGRRLDRGRLVVTR